MPRAYFDNNATTPVLPAVLEAMLPFLRDSFGNASSIHAHGQAAKAALDRARRETAGLIGARPAEIVFTSGGTEADNLAIFGAIGEAAAAPDAVAAHIITSAIDHHAVLNACEELARRGAEVTFVAPAPDGRIRAQDIQRALRSQTRLISVMMANNETGVLQPVEEIAAIARAAGVPFHVDAVQAAGKVPIDVAKLGCDLLSISGHKIHAPQGVGALYVRSGMRLRPLQYGGRHERERRAGTENLPGIVALGTAARIAGADLERESVRLTALRDRLESAITAAVPRSGIIGAGAPRVPNTSALYFDHVEGESLVIALDLKGLSVSSGAACSSGAVEPSHVLLAMGMSKERARSSLRISLGKLTTAEEVERLITAVPECVRQLRAISPPWREAVAAEPVRV
jgi:cysteine desulfurase